MSKASRGLESNTGLLCKENNKSENIGYVLYSLQNHFHALYVPSSVFGGLYEETWHPIFWGEARGVWGNILEKNRHHFCSLFEVFGTCFFYFNGFVEHDGLSHCFVIPIKEL